MNYFSVILGVGFLQTYQQTFSVLKDMWYWGVCVCVCVAEEFFLELVLYNFQHLIVPWLSHCGDKACSVMSCFFIIIKTKPVGKFRHSLRFVGATSYVLLDEI